MTRFRAYYKYLTAVRWQFCCGVFAGLVYAIASGAGLPLMTKVVFPILFRTDDGDSKWWVLWIQDFMQLGDLSQDRLLLLTCLWIPVVFAIRAGAG